MTVTATCPHGLGSPASCFDCMNDEGVVIPPPPRQRYETEVTVTARIDGRCSGCNGPISVGDPIGMVDGVGWVGECCTDA